MQDQITLRPQSGAVLRRAPGRAPMRPKHGDAVRCGQSSDRASNPVEHQQQRCAGRRTTLWNSTTAQGAVLRRTPGRAPGATMAARCGAVRAAAGQGTLLDVNGRDWPDFDKTDSTTAQDAVLRRTQDA